MSNKYYKDIDEILKKVKGWSENTKNFLKRFARIYYNNYSI